jgi:ribosomal protein L37AE/L43A
VSESERVAPFHCPYCGDEDLRPHDTAHETQGAWGCRSCRRVFAVRFIGLWQEAQGQEANA